MRLIETDKDSSEYINADKVLYIYLNPSDGVWYVKVSELNLDIEISKECLKQLLTYGRAI